MRWGRLPIKWDTRRADGVAGLVLGVQSVPDGLATGLLAGVNPLSALHASLVGTVTGACVTSSTSLSTPSSSSSQSTNESKCNSP